MRNEGKKRVRKPDSRIAFETAHGGVVFYLADMDKRTVARVKRQLERYCEYWGIK